MRTEFYRKDYGIYNVVISFFEYNEGFGMHASLVIERGNNTLFTVQFPDLGADFVRIEDVAYEFAKCYAACQLQDVEPANDNNPAN